MPAVLAPMKIDEIVGGDGDDPRDPLVAREPAGSEIELFLRVHAGELGPNAGADFVPDVVGLSGAVLTNDGPDGAVCGIAELSKGVMEGGTR